MARSAGIKVENNFTRGLITEATGLNFPENACVDTDNCEFESEGVVRRRKALDLEASSTLTVPVGTLGVTKEFEETETGLS